MSSNHFINPYNFIPLGKKRAISDSKSGLNTGVIRYSILTKTPLFIPNTSNMHAFENTQLRTKEEKEEERMKSYDFFSYTDLSDHEASCEGEYHKPIIPGSEIRGMLRSNFEILTNSCMSSLETDTVLSKRTNEVFQAGLLKKNGKTYELYEAKDYVWMEEYFKDALKDGFQEGMKVSFACESKGTRLLIAKNVHKNNDPNYPNYQSGYLIIGEKGVKKKHPHIFVPAKSISKDISIETLELVLEEYKNNKEATYDRYRERYKEFKGGKGETYFPVRYSKIENTIMLSPASITREIFEHKLKDCVKDFQPCDQLEKLCPACSLFGTVNETSNFSKASRIRLSDLRSTFVNGEEPTAPKDYYLDTVILPEMSSPKLNNMEFYLKRPYGAIFWTYDYYIKGGQLYSYQAEINGRKFYWHNMIQEIPAVKQDDKKKEKDLKRNIKIRPLKSNVQFEGEMYFNKITDKELQQLIWLISMGKEDQLPLREKKHGYKLGAAKPLGLGSIAMQVDSVTLRKVKKEDGEIAITDVPYEESVDASLFDSDIVKDYLTMTQFDAVDFDKIGYPKPEDNLNAEGFKWFTKNHKKYRNGSLINGMPNKRGEMGFAEYMESMNPQLQETIKTKKYLWIAKYKCSYDQRNKLKQIIGDSRINIVEVKEWLQDKDIDDYAKSYQMILLPSGTKQWLVDKVRNRFLHVYIAKKDPVTQKDSGWKQLK